MFSLLFLLSSSLEPSTPQSDPPYPPVLDITHSPLIPNIKYYILPVIRGRGGGITISTSTCPSAVIQEPYEVSHGLPVIFKPFDGEKGVIRESTDLNIRFSSPGHLNLTSCKDKCTSVWRLDGYDEKTRQWYVTTGGVEGNPGRQTVSNWFKIDKFRDDYKLVFCPSVCSFCKVVCKDVGVFVEKGGNRSLVLNDEPLMVMFKKA
ncbi:hypothetical protein MLD38_036705 [Melastoma candidum]|uniref:Uncharacterized protein n=1 Tax=Melastoma candidum TaxID=119954 RepID=A0ACB9LKX8_9MYRT|nr:hypothetical protein MLD38_036705 [Melastoma candidum]